MSSKSKAQIKKDRENELMSSIEKLGSEFPDLAGKYAVVKVEGKKALNGKVCVKWGKDPVTGKRICIKWENV